MVDGIKSPLMVVGFESPSMDGGLDSHTERSANNGLQWMSVSLSQSSNSYHLLSKDCCGLIGSFEDGCISRQRRKNRRYAKVFYLPKIPSFSEKKLLYDVSRFVLIAF